VSLSHQYTAMMYCLPIRCFSVPLSLFKVFSYSSALLLNETMFRTLIANTTQYFSVYCHLAMFHCHVNALVIIDFIKKYWILQSFVISYFSTSNVYFIVAKTALITSSHFYLSYSCFYDHFFLF